MLVCPGSGGIDAGVVYAMIGRMTGRALLVGVLTLVAAQGAAGAVVSPQMTEEQNLLGDLYAQEEELPEELQEIGRLLRSGKREEAKSKLAAFLASGSPHPVALEMQGSLFLEEGRADDAEAAFRRALELDPGSDGANAKLGALLLGRGDEQEGLERLSDALAANPRNGYAHAALGRWEAGRGNPSAAIGHLRTVIDVLGAPPGTLTPFHIALATEYNRLGRFAEARGVLAGRISDRVPESARAAALQAEVTASLGLGDAAAAAAGIERLAGLRAADDPELLMLRASHLQLTGKPGEAVTLLRGALGDDPEINQGLHLALARVYAGQRKWDAAAGELDAALGAAAGGPDTPEILKQLTGVLMNAGRVEDAKRTLARFAARYPQYPDIGLILASLDASTGDTKAALGRVDEIARTHPERADAQDMRGQLLFMQGRRAEGMAAVREATRLAPTNVHHWMMLSQMTGHASGAEAQARVLEEALAANPGNPDLYYDLALVYSDLGRRTQARMAAQSALQFGLAGPAVDKARALSR